MGESISLQSFGFNDGGDLPPRTSLNKIMNQPFMITQVRDTPTKDHGYGANPNAVTVTTEETITVEEKQYNNFLAIWSVVTEKLKSEQLRKALSDGKSIGPLKLVKQKSDKTGKEYYNIIDA